VKKHNFPYLCHFVLTSGVVLFLYSLWFLVLDRRFVFLYGHLHSTPFDFRTASRYWMTGLVANGVVLIAYTIVNLVIKKVRRDYQLPDWKVIWKYVCLILILPLFIILTFVGKPPTPALLSFWILVVLFAGLRLVLYASNFIVSNFRRSVWAFFDGLALLPILQLLPLSVDYGLRKSSPPVIVIVPLVTILIDLLWFWIMTLLYKRFKQPFTFSLNIFLSGLVSSYLLLPLLHYINSRPGHIRYISDSANFFANEIWLQVTTFLVVVAVLWLVGRWRKNNDFSRVKSLLLWLTIFTVVGYLVMGLTTGKETDICVCKDDQWVKQGNPSYKKPFNKECDILDKAIKGL